MVGCSDSIVAKKSTTSLLVPGAGAGVDFPALVDACGIDWVGSGGAGEALEEAPCDK